MEIAGEGLAFPEGPVVVSDGSVIAVEIAASRSTRSRNDCEEIICEIGGGPNGAAIRPDGALLVCNNDGMSADRMESLSGLGSGGRIERIDLATGKAKRVYDCCNDIRLEGPNDLVFDALVNLWFTDLGKTHSGIRTASGLFCCETNGRSICAVDRHAVSYNAVGLSADDSTVYVADTHQARLYRCAKKPKAQRPRWVATSPGHVSYDSLAVTAAGNTCAGTLRAGGITTITPFGETRFRPFDDRYVTNIAFGGADMLDVWLTFSTRGLLVKARCEEPGLRLHFNG
ncbi:gluconolactonase [Erythromicrobium ramosum]|uniref:Gluconolactonase n=1 Tax=Erythrobacter ramosus TaxID=35811 RepID=A0ABR6I210_9SPHN|nr:SMP-30/gluconolactonase/LRE family protein [Erythrobacter ramosus]MBB3776948.1 gluconolactonase [Erythrobacter ramosus]